MQMTDTISFNARHDRLTTGTILLSDFLKDVVPITSSLDDVDPSHAIVYATGVLSKSQTTRICGVPRLIDLTVVPTQPTFQVVAYLYGLDTNTGKGRLITHSPSTVWNATAGEKFTFSELKFHTSCFELAEGHALALGINMYDNLYKPASTNATIVFQYGKTTLELPIVGDALPDAEVPTAEFLDRQIVIV